MKYNHQNHKGFTLVELLVVLGIMGIIMTAIFSFFLSNVKTFHRADDQIEAQYNAQMAMNQLVDYIIGAKGRDATSTENSNIFNISANEIVQIDYNNDILTYRKGDSPTGVKTEPYVFAENITTFIVSQLPNNKGVSITIVSTKNDAVVRLENKVYFRNAENN